MFQDQMVGRVLVVEDNVALACSWSQQLENRGYEVIHRIDALSALKSCAENWPDAIILDAFFKESCPYHEGSGGLMFCSELFGFLRKTRQKIPFIVGVSGAVAHDDAERGVFGRVPESLMPVRMQKPVTGQQLADCIDKAGIRGFITDRSQLAFAF